MTFSLKPRLAGPALALAVTLSGVSDASAQPAPLSPAEQSALNDILYAFAAATALEFVGGGLEHGFILGMGFIMGAAGGGSLPDLSYGAELDTINLTGPGAGWGVDRVRAVVHSDQGNVRVSAMAGLARTRALGGFAEIGYSAGLRIETTFTSRNTGTIEFIGADGQPRPVLFVQADYNNTGTYRTTDVSFGIKLDF